MPPPGLVIVDGSAYIHRAFHALPPLTNKAGIPTNAAYGFTQMIVRLMREEKAERLVVVFDAGGPTFRDELYPKYKAQRPPTPEELVVQFAWIRRIVEAMHIPSLSVEGVEADDVIATLVDRFEADAAPIVIVSGDKDLMQLVSDDVVMFDTMRDRRFGPKEVEARFGVGPKGVPDVLALMGDSSDNVPGVRGIGEKSAKALIAEFGSVEALIERAPEVESLGLRGAKKIRKLVEEQADDARLSKELVVLRRDVPIDCRLEDFRLRPPDHARLRPLLEELGFQSLVPETSRDGAGKSGTTGWVEDEEAVALLLEAARVAERISLEVVQSPKTAASEGLAIGLAADEAFVRPFDDGAEGAEALKPLAPIFEREGRLVVGGDLKRVHRLLAEASLDLAGPCFDVGVASYVADPTRRGHRVEDLAPDLLRREVSSSRREGPDPPGEVAAERARAALELEPLLADRIREPSLRKLFDEIEMPLVPVLAAMERRGIAVDRSVLDEMSSEFEGRIRGLEGEIHELAGGPFNVGSTAQLREVLFDRLKLSTAGVRKTKTGYSTDVDVLTKLADDHPIAAKLLEYRSLTKLKSTYVDALPLLLSPAGRIHTSFNQTVAATGRLSSSDPNLQNIPVRTEEGRRIRAAFVPSPGLVFVSADYSQIELRILAELSGDELLIEAFRAGEDIHRRTAAELFARDPGNVTADERRAAKAINFGILYGMGPHRLARELGISRKEASEAIARYFERYPAVRGYLDTTLEKGVEHGYVETLYGRRRPVPELRSDNGATRQFAERAAINTPLQGTAADLMKMAMLRVHRRIADAAPGAAILLQVHDELVVEVAESGAEAMEALLVEEMEGVAEFRVPLSVSTSRGRSWAELY